MSPMGGDSLEELSRVRVKGLLDRQALFINYTADGGGNIWLPKLNGAGSEIKRHSGHRDSEVVDVEAIHHEFDARRATRRTSTQLRNDEKLHATCHCSAFQCYLTRPSPEFPKPSAERGKWWLAMTDFEVISWAYVPAYNLFTPDGSLLDPSNDPALKNYDSSPGIHRDFCGACGSPVFSGKDARDVQIWDITVGLLQSDGPGPRTG
ncbi:putative CENP-V/GFA domain-containing protein [Seiridium unicorne]|uniref:CENP-V/GFA domain-containing protein n=1 Tax=Seiridium unicorne TaxID=138068 RepID=A0ABR2UZF7_9PEZI